MVPIVTSAARKLSGVIVMIKEISIAGVPNKWLTLMNHIRHSAPAVYQLMFPDNKTAQDVAKHLVTTIERNPTWFPMKIISRKNTVYVIKEDHIQKAVIKIV